LVGVLDEIIHSGRLIKRRGEKVVSSGERLARRWSGR
jgi:hypothetical protein